jgi:hypothetical protein
VLVGCKQPIGLPKQVHTATTQTVYCTTNINSPTGHIDWFQDKQAIWGWYEVHYATITRAFNYYQPPLDTNRAYPRRNGFCVFTIPHFDCPSGTPACTLYYYQESHYGSADLVVNGWRLPEEEMVWPPWPAQWYYDDMFWAIWNSTDTLATDSTHTNDDCWYKVPLTAEACEAIADSGAIEDHSVVLFTGWIHPSYAANHGVDGWFTDVSGSGANPPFIKVVYDDGQ